MPTEPDPTDEHAPTAHARLLDELVAEAGEPRDRDLVARLVRTALGLGEDRASRLDLKISASALAEMRDAFRVFAPYRDRHKVTVFGSARTRAEDPGYAQARDLAATLARHGWMVVTGAGPGIMLAAAEGAGPEASLGVSIRLPFEPTPNPLLSDDPKHVAMKYFFTRKLMLVKESQGFVAVPGGFGTLDEVLELLTLQQTGKASPVPIVLLDVPGGGYWHGFERFVHDHLVARGLVADDDLERVLVTDSTDAAVAEIRGFWANYHSLRWVGPRLVLRLRAQPTDDEVAALQERFAPLVRTGTIARTEALAPEVRDGDHPGLPRLVLDLDPYAVGSLHQLIRAVNALPSAPAPTTAP